MKFYSNSDIVIYTKITSGSYGDIYLIKIKNSNNLEPRIIKFYRNHDPEDRFKISTDFLKELTLINLFNKIDPELTHKLEGIFIPDQNFIGLGPIIRKDVQFYCIGLIFEKLDYNLLENKYLLNKNNLISIIEKLHKIQTYAILHSDIKNTNIMIKNGKFKIIDFGLSFFVGYDKSFHNKLKNNNLYHDNLNNDKLFQNVKNVWRDFLSTYYIDSLEPKKLTFITSTRYNIQESCEKEISKNNLLQPYKKVYITELKDKNIAYSLKFNYMQKYFKINDNLRTIKDCLNRDKDDIISLKDDNNIFNNFRISEIDNFLTKLPLYDGIIIKNTYPGYASDIFSLGTSLISIILQKHYEIFCSLKINEKRYLFEKKYENSIKYHYEANLFTMNNFLGLINEYSKEYKELLILMVDLDSNSRPSFKSILEILKSNEFNNIDLRIKDNNQSQNNIIVRNQIKFKERGIKDNINSLNFNFETIDEADKEIEEKEILKKHENYNLNIDIFNNYKDKLIIINSFSFDEYQLILFCDIIFFSMENFGEYIDIFLNTIFKTKNKKNDNFKEILFANFIFSTSIFSPQILNTTDYLHIFEENYDDEYVEKYDKAIIKELEDENYYDFIPFSFYIDYFYTNNIDKEKIVSLLIIWIIFYNGPEKIFKISEVIEKLYKNINSDSYDIFNYLNLKMNNDFKNNILNISQILIEKNSNSYLAKHLLFLNELTINHN